MSDSIGPLYTIDGGQNADTSQAGANPSSWLDMSWVTGPIGFSIAGTWVGTIAIDFSFDPTPITKTVSSSINYAANTGTLGLPRNIGNFIRFRRVAWTSGSAKIGVGNGVDSSGHSKPVTIESVKTN